MNNAINSNRQLFGIRDVLLVVESFKVVIKHQDLNCKNHDSIIHSAGKAVKQ